VQWGADQQAFAQRFEPEKFGIAKVVVECRLECEDHVWFEDQWMVSSLCDE
jgi:hypothetical protein